MKYTTKDIGCYFDGAYGFEHNGQRLLHMAGAHGFDWTPIDMEKPSDDDYETFMYEVSSAEEYLNEHTIRPDNTHWSWEDGDFGLWQYDEDGEEECVEVDA